MEALGARVRRLKNGTRLLTVTATEMASHRDELAIWPRDIEIFIRY